MSLVTLGILFRSWYRLASILASLREDVIAGSSELSAYMVSLPKLEYSSARRKVLWGLMSKQSLTAPGIKPGSAERAES